MNAEKRYVIVTDYHRGVVYGRLSEWDRGRRVAVLEEARHVYYWALQEGAEGLFGLATVGPAEGSRIGPAVGRVEITEVAKVIDCEPAAIDRWASARWSR
jgi:hypothetical protein